MSLDLAKRYFNMRTGMHTDVAIPASDLRVPISIFSAFRNNYLLGLADGGHLAAFREFLGTTGYRTQIPGLLKSVMKVGTMDFFHFVRQEFRYVAHRSELWLPMAIKAGDGPLVRWCLENPDLSNAGSQTFIISRVEVYDTVHNGHVEVIDALLEFEERYPERIIYNRPQNLIDIYRNPLGQRMPLRVSVLIESLQVSKWVQKKRRFQKPQQKVPPSSEDLMARWWRDNPGVCCDLIPSFVFDWNLP